jgi:catalase (peroxidase I)
MMLTSDVSLTKDPAGLYQTIVKEFADDMEAFTLAFSHAWYKLTTRDMGPVTRCVGPDVPPAQPWQHPLPPPAPLADFDKVSALPHPNPHCSFVIRASLWLPWLPW